MSLRYHDTIIHGGLADTPDDIDRALHASQAHTPSLPFELSADTTLIPMACLSHHTDTG